MSRAAYGESRRFRRQCVSCHARKALFRYRDIVKADRDHTLCFECFRAERDRSRARLLASIPPPRPLRAAPFAPLALLAPLAPTRVSSLAPTIEVQIDLPRGVIGVTESADIHRQRDFHRNTRFNPLSSRPSCCMSFT